MGAQAMKGRILIASLSLSAVAFGGLVMQEGYTDRAVIPVKNDRPTVGFGSTFREDGSPVEMGDMITPPKAVARSLAHIQNDERGLKRCIAPTVALHQSEYDLLVDFSYQYGVAATCKSGMVRNYEAGDFTAACHVYAEYRKVAGRDCSKPENHGPRGCRGVWLRAIERRDRCLASLK